MAKRAPFFRVRALTEMPVSVAIPLWPAATLPFCFHDGTQSQHSIEAPLAVAPRPVAVPFFRFETEHVVRFAVQLYYYVVLFVASSVPLCSEVIRLSEYIAFWRTLFYFTAYAPRASYDGRLAVTVRR